VDNNYLDLGMSKSGFIHTLPSGRLTYDVINHKDYNVYKKSKSKDSCGLASTSNPAGGLMGRGGQGGLFGNSAFWMSLPRFSRAP
jgi:hypothetical protein